MGRTYLQTSESVSAGHPDKIADQVSDGVLDAALAADPRARVACECLVAGDLVVIAGEVTTTSEPDYAGIARETIRRIGYVDDELGLDCGTCEVRTAVGRQSEDIDRGVTRDGSDPRDQGAGDQGLVFGYACNETPVLMPLPIHHAHRLMRRHAELRREGRRPWLRPDAKCQLTVRYVDGRPRAIETVVVSVQHAPEVGEAELRRTVIEEIVRPVLSGDLTGDGVRILVNPTGRFVVGGPRGDCGLTGRKIAVDSYGGAARHGGGAFSGKDPSKVDRSGAYAARWVAKNVVAAGLAERCEVQIAYAIGTAKPVGLTIDTFGTGAIDEARIEKLVRDRFDLRPGAIIESLDLLRPIYSATAVHGHFGREEPGFAWERTDRADDLRRDAGL